MTVGVTGLIGSGFTTVTYTTVDCVLSEFAPALFCQLHVYGVVSKMTSVMMPEDSPAGTGESVVRPASKACAFAEP